MINYAHRGASEYAPENTLSSFYLGLLQGANGIETDVQQTKDGVLVLFHDDTLDRVTNVSGRLCDFTYEQLRKIKVFGNCTTGFFDRVVTLKDFLSAFADYDISFAIELKGPGVEEGVLNMIKEFDIMEKTTFTSFQFSYIEKVKSLDATARVGWLTYGASEEQIAALKAIGGEEMAPMADNITANMVEKLRSAGLGIRAWGVSNTEIMKKMCHLGVDGMTVNFPDRLYQYWNTLDRK